MASVLINVTVPSRLVSAKLSHKKSPISTALKDSEMDEYAVYRMAFVLLMLALCIGMYLGVKNWRSYYPRKSRQNRYDLLQTRNFDSEMILRNISDDSDDDVELFDRINSDIPTLVVPSMDKSLS